MEWNTSSASWVTGFAIKGLVCFVLVMMATISGCGGGGGSTIDGGSATIVPTRPLNDTGITTYGDEGSSNLASEPTGYPGQDASYGRDALAAAGQLVKIGGGSKGFDFTKIANDGTELDASAALGSGARDWACTRDNVTGLLWELKSTTGLRQWDSTYTWYSSDATSNGGDSGTPAGGRCFAAGRCDTEKYVQDVNAAGLCGHSDWRMPSMNELVSIVDYGKATTPIDLGKPIFAAIDNDWFPNTVGLGFKFWTGLGGHGYAALVYSELGAIRGEQKNASHPIRLVRAALGTMVNAPAVSVEQAQQDCNPAIPASTPTADFRDNGDGTVLHKLTGLIWMRCALGQTWNGSTCTGTAGNYSWQQALQAAKTLDGAGGYAGNADWRLPNIKELLSIVEWRCRLPSINVSVFPATDVTVFLSAAVYPDIYMMPGVTYFVDHPNVVSRFVWSVNFGGGGPTSWSKWDGANIRLVRTGQ